MRVTQISPKRAAIAPDRRAHARVLAVTFQDGAVLWRTVRVKERSAIGPASHELLGRRGEGIEGVVLALRMVLFPNAELTDISDGVVKPQLIVHQVDSRGTSLEKTLNVAGRGIGAAERPRLPLQRPLHIRDDLNDVTA